MLRKIKLYFMSRKVMREELSRLKEDMLYFKKRCIDIKSKLERSNLALESCRAGMDVYKERIEELESHTIKLSASYANHLTNKDSAFRFILIIENEDKRIKAVKEYINGMVDESMKKIRDTRITGPKESTGCSSQYLSVNEGLK